jgi:hypothetical protein
MAPPGSRRAVAFEDVLPEKLIDLMIKDAEAVTEYEASLGNLKDYKRRTRWLPKESRPKTALELAIRRLEAFAKPGSNGREYVGAEWWVQNVEPSGPQSIIGFHLDKDEAIASNEHYLVHPEWGSIFYLTHTGGCTLVFDQHSPNGNGYEPVEALEAELSCPKRNKFFIFNGTLLHGVIPGRDEHKVEPRRITFLVNWWTQRPRPPNCDVIDHRQVKGLTYLSKKKLEQLKEELGDLDAMSRKRVAFKKLDLVGPNAVETYRFEYRLPGDKRASTILPKNIERGATYTLFYKARATDAKDSL